MFEAVVNAGSPLKILVFSTYCVACHKCRFDNPENVVRVSCNIIVYCFTLCRAPCSEKFQAKSGLQKEI